jgi:dienelactone hydrolase
VFLVGHSMGAGQALALAANGKFAAVAALGGGGRLSKPAAFAELPTFVGVGDKDSLALAGARALNKALTAANAKAVTYKEYPGVEHLVIVREALPDAFAVFDKVAGK